MGGGEGPDLAGVDHFAGNRLFPVLGHRAKALGREYLPASDIRHMKCYK